MTIFNLSKQVSVPLVIHTVLFALVVGGIVPRPVVLVWTLALLAWAAWADSLTGSVFFAAAIPLFIAIPITADYDNLTMWRPLSIVIFLKWFLGSFGRRDIVSGLRWLLGNVRGIPTRFPIGASLAVLALASVISLVVAPDLGVGIRRIILYSNAVLVPIVLFWYVRRDRLVAEQLLGAISYSVVVVVAVAFLQVASTYVIDIYQFMRIWGEEIQLRQFGALWSQIVIYLGNTWFAYYGPQLSLRVFSLFPDSHSFPLYVILALGGLMAFSVRTLMTRAPGHSTLSTLLNTRANRGVVWIPLGLLAVILSGTRGIWAAAAGLPFVAAVIWYALRGTPARRPLWLWLSSWLVVIALLFAVAYPVFVSPQFLLSKGNLDLFAQRFRSILDIDETSNRQRLAIWSASLESIRERPLIGVGIGNFPVVLEQRIFLARAGSTAHNIYLHIAAETGLIALLAWLWLWVVLYQRTYRMFRDGLSSLWLGYDGWLLLAIPWVAAYLLTDAALLDERTLLLFGITVALISGRASQDHATS